MNIQTGPNVDNKMNFEAIIFEVDESSYMTLSIESYFKEICTVRTPTPKERLIGGLIGAPFIPTLLFLLGTTSF
jgi:hypothetical protein